MADTPNADRELQMARLLLGIPNARVFEALAAHGFTKADYEEGWTLLRRVAGARIREPESVPPSVDVVSRVDAWEDRWFAIIQATLNRVDPALCEEVFHGLAQADGQAAVESVRTLLARLDALRSSKEARSRAACERLERRGLTPAVLDEVRKLLSPVDAASAAPGAGHHELTEQEIHAAEEAMRGYYDEWSTIARSAVSDRRLLRRLGLSTAKR
ncbi:MAG: hypothetical protein JNL21_00175, partial [Myxococcales bacterium]|nr:hypothetical protein [Myxococcales bacterium]